MKYGERINFLLDKDPTLAPGEMGSWKPGDEALAGWAPGWRPINKHTVTNEDTNASNPLCRAVGDRMSNFLFDDDHGVLAGVRLPEATTPAERYVSYSDIIRIHNKGCGYCTRCNCVLTEVAMVQRPTYRHRDALYGELGDTWSVDRIENHVMHIASNVCDMPICK